MPSAHTLETLTKELQDKGRPELKIVSFEVGTKSGDVILLDPLYGEYTVDIKSFCPKGKIPSHRSRRKNTKAEAFRVKYTGKYIKGLKIVDTFYGPHNGYKNRSNYVVVETSCGHSTSITTLSHLTKHRESVVCRECSHAVHGFRGKQNGDRVKRTKEYIYWVAHKSEIPEQYKHDFSLFYHTVGPKKTRTSILAKIGDAFVWLDPSLRDVDTDEDVNLIAIATRSAFQRSRLYADALDRARVETETCSKYRCADCLELFKLDEVQVDHVDPIRPLSGEPLTKATVIDRVFTDNLQILHSECHRRKSLSENKTRNQNKRIRLKSIDKKYK